MSHSDGADGVSFYTTFRHLGGGEVPLAAVVEEIQRLGLPSILEFLSGASIAAVHEGQRYFDPRRQAHYLNPAIVDDFPWVLPGAAKMYAPGAFRTRGTGTSSFTKRR